MEQVERKTDAGELASSVHESVDTRKNLKQDVPESIAQGTKPESYKSDSTDIDRLNVEKVQDTKAEGAINKKEPQHEKNKVSAVEKTIGRCEQSDKDVADLKKDLQVDKKVDVEGNKPSGKKTAKLLERKKRKIKLKKKK